MHHSFESAGRRSGVAGESSLLRPIILVKSKPQSRTGRLRMRRSNAINRLDKYLTSSPITAPSNSPRKARHTTGCQTNKRPATYKRSISHLMLGKKNGGVLQSYQSQKARIRAPQRSRPVNSRSVVRKRTCDRSECSLDEKLEHAYVL